MNCLGSEYRTASTGPVIRANRGSYGAGALHRWDEPVLANEDKGGVDRFVALVGTAGDDRRAWLEIGPRAGLKRDDRGLGVDDDRLLSALVRHGEPGAGRRIDARRDIAVGHRTLRRKVEGAEALAGPAHGLGKDVHFHRLELGAFARQGGDADEAPGLHVGKRRRNDEDEAGLGIEVDRLLLARAGADA